MEQRTLARAGSSFDGDKFPRLHGQIDVLQYLNDTLAHPKRLLQSSGAQDRLAGGRLLRDGLRGNLGHRVNSTPSAMLRPGSSSPRGWPEPANQSPTR